MPRARLLPIGICATVALLACVGFEEFVRHGLTPQERTRPVPEGEAAIPAIVRALRPIYPYSVIPGGVYAANELRTALQSDRTVRQHYAGFAAEKVHFVSLKSDSYRYVSYRQGGKICWTKKKLLIPKGELLFTDGERYARARCGNRLAEQSSGPTSATEPTVEALSPGPFNVTNGDRANFQLEGAHLQYPESLTPVQIGIPEFEEGLLAKEPSIVQLSSTPAGTVPVRTGAASEKFFNPFLTPVVVVFPPPTPLTFLRGTSSGGGGTATGTTPPKQPMPIPEPETGGLLGAGLAGLCWIARRRVRRVQAL